MSSDKVFLTYKRKRFSFQTDFIHDTKATNLSPIIQRGSSEIYSPKSECDANDEILNNHHTKKCQCSTCNGRYGVAESSQQHVPPSEGMRLRSNRMLSSIKVENISEQATTPIISESQSNIMDTIQIDGLGEKTGSSTALVAVHDRMGNPINLNVNLATEGGSNSGCPEVGEGENMLCNDGALKEHSCAQLITFSRRTKAKQDAGERMTDKILKIVEKNSVSAISSRIVGADFSCEGSSREHIVEEQTKSQPILFENCVVLSSQVDVADEMDDVNIDASSDYTAEVHTRSKIQKISETSSGFGIPPVSALDTCKEELSKEFSTVQPVYVCPPKTEPPNSRNNFFILNVEESGSKLITGTNNSEKRTITHLSEKNDSLPNLDLSVAPSSVCQMNLNLEENKLSNDILVENHRDSQNDEENDARCKEIEWLESIDNVLMEKKKDRGTCSLMVDKVFNFREGFNSMMACKSTERSVDNQSTGIEFVSHLTALPERISLANLRNPSFEDQLKTEKSTSFTDFLGRYSPSNPDLPFDLNATAPAPSGSLFRDNTYMHDWKLPYSSKGNTSLFKHKYITSNSIAEMVLNRKRGSLSDKPKGYSNEWSEEDLDFLWIGVRRHGVDNWNAILRDPKLQFTRSRFAEDLALQWEQEQKKLFNGTLYPSARMPKPNTSLPLLEGHYTAKAHAFTENHHLPETRLSLGDVYLHKDNTVKTSPFVLTYPPPPNTDGLSAGPFLGSSFLSLSSYPGASIRHKNFCGGSRAMYQMDHCFHKQFRERSGNQQKPAAGLPTRSDLPHWLKEAYSSHPSPSDLCWPPPLFAAGNAPSLVNNDAGSEPLTSKDLRGRGILKRKTMACGTNPGIIKIEEASSASIEESGSIKLCVAPPTQIPACEKPAIAIGSSSHQKDITDLSDDNNPVSVVPNDLVVLDSDASSEETISDDQNGRT